MARELAVVLANGSIQSAVTCAIAAQKYRTVMIHVDTSPSTGRSGLAFDALVQHFKPYRSHRVAMPFLSSIAMTDSNLAAADPRSTQNTTATLIELMPILSIGLRFAMHYNCNSLFCGARVGTESADLARITEFGQIWTEMVQMTCDRPDLEVIMPLLEMDLWQVVDLGVQLAAPLQLAWTCENSVGEACGECRHCRERDAAFQRAGRADPTKVAHKAAS